VRGRRRRRQRRRRRGGEWMDRRREVGGAANLSGNIRCVTVRDHIHYHTEIALPLFIRAAG
jgi:hypothetical protein